jgi:hypothetical protein
MISIFDATTRYIGELAPVCRTCRCAGFTGQGVPILAIDERPALDL